ncbi:MAG: TIGR00341 family protein [Bacteroidales bacterium]|nr:TIGR00341 family protein [Bacteroidales bacterium]
MTNFEQDTFKEDQKEISTGEHAQQALLSIWKRIKELARLEKDTDHEATTAYINASVEFKGFNLWILALAVIVASVGLNMNATAVIIGAMLISPLMGPIHGVGLGVGIMDVDLLKKSLKNLGVMVVISLLASTIYFFLSPLNEARSELLARTSPTIFDVLIAFFGGMAGIIAISQKKQSVTVISGVAIATALMPPLCTAGYGLGTGQTRYFFGAFYLFFINAFFIALATLIIVRYLQFPSKTYLDPLRNRTVKRFITIFSIIVLTPSIFMAVRVIRETSFQSESTRYINEIQKSKIFENTQILNVQKNYSHKHSTITLSLIGEELNKKEIAVLQEKMLEFGIKNTDLIIKQTESIVNANMQTEILEQMLDQKNIQIANRDSAILHLKKSLLMVNADSNLSRHIAKEISAQYPFVASFSINNAIYTNPHTLQNDTLPTALLTWKTAPSATSLQQLETWLRIRLDLDTIKIIANQ